MRRCFGVGWMHNFSLNNIYVIRYYWTQDFLDSCKLVNFFYKGFVHVFCKHPTTSWILCATLKADETLSETNICIKMAKDKYIGSYDNTYLKLSHIFRHLNIIEEGINASPEWLYIPATCPPWLMTGPPIPS
jgi:hypothetical protein